MFMCYIFVALYFLSIYSSCTGQIIKTENGFETDLFKPCNSADVDCIRISAGKFLEGSYEGIPKYGVKPIDPFFIPSMSLVLDENEGFTSKLHDVKITGLKNQTLNSFKLDKKDQSVNMLLATTLDINGDLVAEYIKKPVSLSGSFSTRVQILETINYSYEVKKDDKEVEHFIMRDVVTNCRIVSSPEVILEMRATDPDNSQMEMEKIRKMDICAIVSEGYNTIVHNFKTSSKILPITALFTDF